MRRKIPVRAAVARRDDKLPLAVKMCTEITAAKHRNCGHNSS